MTPDEAAALRICVELLEEDAADLQARGVGTLYWERGIGMEDAARRLRSSLRSLGVEIGEGRT